MTLKWIHYRISCGLCFPLFSTLNLTQYFQVVLSLLISAALSESEADPQDNLAGLPTFQQQFAANLAKAGGNVPGRFSYFVNSVHPVHPKRAQPKESDAEDSAEAAADLPVPAVLPQYNIPAWNGLQGYNGYNAYNPWAAGYNALGYPWGRRGYYGGLGGYSGLGRYGGLGGYGGYNGYPNYSAYPGYGYGLNPYAYPVGGVGGPNAEEE